MKIRLHRVTGILLSIIMVTLIVSCTREAATINPMAVTGTNTPGDPGTEYPQIYAVFPGRLTSHTGSPGVMTGITPGDTANDITIVFTRVMDGASVNSAIHVYEGDTGSTSPVFTVSTANSQSYAVNITGGLAESTTYRVVIDNTAHLPSLSGEPSLNLDFSNLEALYAGSLTDVTEATSSVNDVEFQFTTAASGTVSDTEPPALSATNPLDAATNVPIGLTGSNGRIEFTFSEPVDPTTVTGLSITLAGTSAGPVTGTVGRIDATNTKFFFLPASELNYEDTYTLTVSAGNAVKDYAGNPMVQAAISFSTPLYSTVPASINADSVYVVYDPANPTQVTIHWTTDIKSITHVEIDNAETFAAADNTHHSAALTYNHSHTFTVARNQVYSFSISTNSDPGTAPGGPFNQTLYFNALIRTTPDTSHNYQLAVNGSDETGLKSCQLDVNRSFLIWKSGTGLYAQYMDSSSGTAGSWCEWAASGESLFAAGGLISIISDGTTGAVVSGVNGGDIYASSIYDDALTGMMAYTWGSGGLQVYDGSAANARMALTNSVYVSTVKSGTAETNYIYDADQTFSTMLALGSGDHMINIDILAGTSGHTTVSEVCGDAMLRLAADRITSSYLNYRIGDADPGTTKTANVTWYTSGQTTIYFNSNSLEAEDIITNDTNYTYITNKVGGSAPYFEYTTYLASGFSYNESVTTYDYITHGTADKNTLYDLSGDFSAAGVTAGDIVINTATGAYDLAVSVYADNHDLLILSDSAKFLFDTDGQAYSIFRLPVPGDYVTCGRSTGIGTLTVTVSGIEETVQPGDIIYRIDNNTYAKITAVTATTLTLDQQIFTGTGQNFIIYRWSGVTFAWEESGNIYGKTVNLANGSRVYPSAIVTDFFEITDVAAVTRNPYIIGSTCGDAIVVYERDSGGGKWSINAKKIRSDGTFAWTDPAADQITDAGIAVSTTAFTPAGACLIKDVISDSKGGCWALYETDAPSVRVAHISSAGAVTTYDMTTSANAAIASVSATEVVVVYEFGASPSIIYASRFTNTPSAGPAVKVSPGTVQYSQLNPRVCGDGSGGAIISWLDMRYFPSVYYSIYTQHLDSSLTQTYSADKFTAIPVLDNQGVSPYLIDHSILRYNDGAGLYEGIHFWTDERGASKDIYYQNITN
jgi:hypothetical protein